MMDENRVVKNVIVYYILLLASVSLFSITNGNSAIMYIGYCVSFFYFFCCYVVFSHKLVRKMFIIGSLLLFSGLLTLLLNTEHLFDSMKSIGINVNVIIPFLYMIVLGAVSNRGIHLKTINTILYWFSLICFIVSLVTIILNINVLRSLFAFSGNAYTTVLKGFFPNKNMFGNYVAIGAIISVYNICLEKKKLYYIIAIILSVLTILSLSRAAILLLALFCVFFGVSSLKNDNTQENKRLRHLILFAIAIALGLLIVIFTNDSLKSFILLKVFRLDTGDAGRTSIHSMAYELLKQSSPIHLLFGYGASGLEYRISYDLHSTFLNVLLTGGAVKLVLFFVSLIYSYRSCKKINNRMMKSFCLSCLFAYIIYSFFETVVFFELGLFHFIIFFIILFIPNTVLCESMQSDFESNSVVPNR